MTEYFKYFNAVIFSFPMSSHSQCPSPPLSSRHSGMWNSNVEGRLADLQELERQLKAQVAMRNAVAASPNPIEGRRMPTSEDHLKAVSAAVMNFLDGGSDAQTLKLQLLGEQAGPSTAASAAEGARVQRKLYAEEGGGGATESEGRGASDAT